MIGIYNNVLSYSLYLYVCISIVCMFLLGRYCSLYVVYMSFIVVYCSLFLYIFKIFFKMDLISQIACLIILATNNITYYNTYEK